MAINVDIDLMVEESPEVSMSVDNIDEVQFGVDPSILVGDHDKLINRDADDQHPISAITGLEEALSQSGRISTIQRNGVDLPIVNKTVNIQVPVESVNGKTGTVSLNANDVGALPDSTVIPDDSNLVHKTGEETITGKKTFTNSAEISRSNSGPILKLSSSAADTNFILERTGGSQCVLESGSSLGLFGTKTNHPLQIRTNYTNRMTIGTDGSVVLATDVASGSNSNQVATTKWVNAKGYATTSQIPTKTSDLTNDSGFITASDVPKEVFPVNVTLTSQDMSSGVSDKSSQEIYQATLDGKLPVVNIAVPTMGLVMSAALAHAQVDDGVYAAFFSYDNQSAPPYHATLRVIGYGVVITMTGQPFVLGRDLAEVAISGSYSDLWGTPTIPTATSDLTNDSGYITVSEAPVTSVNGQTGSVALTATDVGAYASDNPAGYITIGDVPVTSVNGRTGDVTGLAETSALDNYLNKTTGGRVAGMLTMDALIYMNGQSITFAKASGTPTASGSIQFQTEVDGATATRWSERAIGEDLYFNAPGQNLSYIIFKNDSSIEAKTQATTDNSNKVATTAFVKSVLPTNVSSFTNDAGYLVASDFVEVTDAEIHAIVV